MSTPASELEHFQRFVAEKVSSGELDLSPEEILDQWRSAHPVDDEFISTVAALREALADMAAGDSGKPLDKFDRDFQARHGESAAP